ncbi:hypothetical protein GE061_005788 [Apolygus lucorum]|uniref:Uncharacterized protein n=1 Tax=Apolygus lucorum TaxID=248454 RepID=A0A8S9WWN9_APOLU|nr:hypothetical protein GE061_005788 [Apolygus lucorum]
MVLRRGDARHKNVPDPLEAGPKRITTIHAQRKFAQGSGMNSPAMSPIKEKEKSKVNGASDSSAPSTSTAIPAKRPRTEDFITFLCYRGTSVLPPALNSFNVASKPEKNERETSSITGSSKPAASPSRQEKEDKLKRAKQTKRMVMQSKSKVLDQRQRKTRLNAIAAQKAGKVLKNRNVNPPISKVRLKKAAVAVVNANSKQLKTRPAVPIRASHPSILKRISASRARAGLRSGGQLPPETDAGNKTDKKSRDQTILRGKQLVGNNKRKVLTPVRMKVKRVSKASSVTPISQRLKRGRQPLPKSTQRRTSPPKSLNIATRPSRKTKEAATLYMEMITKDLRSPDDDEEEDIVESPLKSEDMDVDSSPLKKRTRSAHVESTPDVSPARGQQKKPLRKIDATPQSPSPSSGNRRSLKRITGLTSNMKALTKRTRASNKGETPQEDLEEEPKSQRTSRRSAASGKNIQVTTPTSTKSKRLAGTPAKKSASPKRSVSGKNEEILDKSGYSSHSDEEGESSSSHPSPKKARKLSEGKSGKALSSGGKKSGVLRKSVDPPKKEGKQSVKETEDEDNEGDKSSKRATRSAGGDTSIKGVGKDISGDVGKRGPVKSKTRGQTVRKQSSSESETSEEEDSGKNVLNKDSAVRTRRSIKKEPESESEEDLDEETKNVVKKPTRQSRSSAKVQENDVTADDKPANKRQSRTAKSKVNNTTEKESEEEVEVEHSPTRKQASRSKKQVLAKEEEKPVESEDKRATRKSAQVSDEKPTKAAGKSRKVETKLMTDSEDSLSEEENGKKAVRRTRISKLGTQEPESAKKAEPQVKRTRHSVNIGKSDESENEDTSNKKSKRTSKPVPSKVEMTDESDKEDSGSRRPGRPAAVKSEAPVDSGPEGGGVKKHLKKLRQSLKTESGGESDKDSQPKRLRQAGKKLPEPAEKESDKPEKELNKSIKSGIKKSIKNVDDVEDDVKKGSTAKSSASGKINAGAAKDETGTSEVVAKRSSRFGQQSSPADTKTNNSDVTIQNSKELVTAKSADVDSKKDVTPKQTRSTTKSDYSSEAEVKNVSEKDTPKRSGRAGSKVTIKEKSELESIPDKKEISTRQSKPTSKQAASEVDGKKDVVAESKVTDAKEGNKKSEPPAKKSTKKVEVKKETKEKQVKEVVTPAKRGRKPKKVESDSGAEKVSEENQTRPRRNRRAVAKRESYSEFSDEEEEEDDEVDITLPRTRERKSNIRYTEKDTDESEVVEESEGEVEKRPQRSRRSVFPTSLALDLDSEEEFDELPPRPRRNKSKPNEKEVESDSNYTDEEDVDDAINQQTSKVTGASKIPEANSRQQPENKSVSAPKSPEQSPLVNKPLDKVIHEDGNASDSSKKSRNSRRNSWSSKEFLENKKTVDKISDNSLAPLDSALSAPKSSDTPAPVGKDTNAKTSQMLCAAPVNLEHPVTTGVLEKASHLKQEMLVNSTSGNVSRVDLVPDVKQEPKRMSRRLSKDNYVDSTPLAQGSIDFKTTLIGNSGRHEHVSQAVVSDSTVTSSSFGMNPPNKGEHYDALAILSDVAFSELQNRKIIMDRKLSSDSATSFSSDDVPLPVRKEKVLPKAKADLPTVREKTESDEEISDVGNEDTDDDSSYEEYRKVDKQPRRKRLPRRTRKEPVRQQQQQPQRPVRSRRAKQTDSYIVEDYFSSDRSSTPEVPPVKSVQKKRRKSEDKHPVAQTSSISPKPAVQVNSSPITSITVSPSTPSVPELEISKEPIIPVLKPTKEVKPSVPFREEIQKVPEITRNIPAKILPLKAVVQADPVLNVPRPLPTQPQTVSKVKVTMHNDVKNNNSVTLFSGVSGVTVTKSDSRVTLVHSSPAPKEVPSQVGHSFPGAARSAMDSPVKQPPPYVPGRSAALSSSQSIPKNNLFNLKNSPDSNSLGSSVDSKPKPNIGDTWKNAFKNAKIPKAGQLSPAHHSSVGTPFTRKPFSSTPKPATKPDDAKPNAFVPTKLPSVQTFKPTSFPNFAKLGNQSPSRMPGGMSPNRPPIPVAPVDTKSNVYLSPSRVKNSPSKFDEKPEAKKPDSTPTKSLTLLQYEKRSQELISSLKGSQPIMVEGIQTFAQAFPKLKEYNMEKAKSSPVKVPVPPQQPSAEDTSKSEGGKHLNLPFAVEHAFRKRSPITVKKPVKLPVEKRAGPSITIPEVPTPSVPSIPRDRPVAAVPSPSSELNRATANIELLSKKKVQMTNEEIKKWLDDNTSSGVEHAKDCGIFENNQCECSYRTSGESMLNTSVGGVAEVTIKKEDPKIDHGVVEPPVQLKELDSGAKFTAETISTCKVEDYKEKMLIKAPKVPPPAPEVKKELVPPVLPKPKKPMNLVVDRSKRKSSMTEDEMCDFDFRFERTSNSPRESCSDMSSPTPRDDVSSSNEDKFDPSSGGLEKKSIFNQRRQVPGPVKRPPLSKSPCAFSAENESSVYAFEPDAPPPALNNPFRRRGSRHKSSEDDCPASSSIAVQVNLENVASGDNDQLECSTQTEQVENEGQLFYFPLEGDNNPQEVIQGVQVKLQSTEGPEQKVIMKAKLVTKPSLNIPSSAAARPLGDAGRAPQRPEQKVRPLASTSTSTQSKPLGTVQPTIREPQPSCSASFTSQGTTTTSDRPDLANQSTQAAAVPQVPPSPRTQPTPPPQAEAAKPVESPAPISVPKPPVKSAPVTPAARKSTNEFPVPGSTARMVDALTFYPTEKEFQDPLEYIERITPQARSFGICKIVPPATFKPECKVTDDMRFTAYNQYVHKMLYRWGPNVREMTAIKKYLATQCIALKQPPLIGGMEIDLPRLYQTVQSCGGLKEVIEKKRWAKVADVMKIPKAAQDRVTKLDDIYCKFLLPYDTLSHSERSKLLEEVDAEWTERERRIALEAERESKGEKEEKEDNSESDEESDDGRDECMTKGKTMPLSQFYRVARNTMAMWFKETNPSAKDVENEYWRLVTSRKQHVCVNSGSIDSGASGYGFPTSKSSSTSRHPWNLKVLTNNGGSILRSMGPIMGVTVPTLHVGMLFSACCWYRDPHGLPWIEYLHTGANKIWYAVPDLWNEELHGAMRTILPRYCQDKPIWLASDTAMVPPDLLVQQRVSLCRAVQEPGQFILVFPKAFTSTICTGYIVSESVYFAQPTWLDSAPQIFKDIQESCEPPAFSMERLLFNMATDVRSSAEVLTQILPMIIELRDTELKQRKDLEDLGVTESERLAVSKGGRKRSQEEPQEYECEICRGNLYLSLVTNSVEEANFCLLHSVETLTKDRSHVKNCKLMYSYDEEEMDEVIQHAWTLFRSYPACLNPFQVISSLPEPFPGHPACLNSFQVIRLA